MTKKLTWFAVAIALAVAGPSEGLGQYYSYPAARAYYPPGGQMIQNQYARHYGVVPAAHQPLAPEGVPAPIPDAIPDTLPPQAGGHLAPVTSGPTLEELSAAAAPGGCNCPDCASGNCAAGCGCGCGGGGCDGGVYPVYGGGCDVGVGCDGSCGGGCGGVWDTYGCDGSCGGCCEECCVPFDATARCFRMFGEYLYLRPRDAEVAYAVPIDGPISNPSDDVPVQVGPTALVDPGFDSGYRVGFSLGMDETAEVMVTFTDFESSESDEAQINPGQVLFPMVIHPTSFNAATTVLQAFAEQSIRYELVDLDYRGLLCSGCRHSVHYLLGIRYGRLEQEFNAQYDFNGTTNVLTNLKFDGAGIRIGLDGERASAYNRFSLYGRSTANFLAGEFNGSYLQTDAFAPIVANTSWESGRVVTILELELGLAYRSCNDRWRIHAGYMMTAWLNALKTEEFIEAVQTNRLDDLSDSFTFDGLTAGLEYRF